MCDFGLRSLLHQVNSSSVFHERRAIEFCTQIYTEIYLEKKRNEPSFDIKENPHFNTAKITYFVQYISQALCNGDHAPKKIIKLSTPV